MRNTIFLGLIALLSASSLAAQDRSQTSQNRPNRGGQSVPSSSPSVIVAAESRFERLAREEGLWTAFRETATDDAFSFTPNLQSVAEWLNNRKDPAESPTWDPYHVIMSCDGSLAASRGAWSSIDGSETGYYTTIWQRQRKGGYKWVFDHASNVPSVDGEANAVTSQRGDCQRAQRRNDRNENAQQDGLPQGETQSPPSDRGGAQRNGRKTKKRKPRDPLPVAINISGAHKTVSGHSFDRTLIWKAIQRPDGTRTLNVELLKDGEYITVINDELGTIRQTTEKPQP
ncbi:hypothetical protein ACR9YC_12650 [Parasphingorhabdus sp. DH2-15]|uniref:hypothetical protein n=1 Tax=Parasphingorhabdus sp. DH2-15 TaxID=3444112 RepID=UPI003F684CB6